MSVLFSKLGNSEGKFPYTSQENALALSSLFNFRGAFVLEMSGITVKV